MRFFALIINPGWSTFSEVAVYLPVEGSWAEGIMKEPDPRQPWAWGEE